jgi:ABC-2 type transport system permease protein
MTSISGTGQLIRLALRRDRILLPVCVTLLALIATSSASATIKIYPTAESVAQAARSTNSTPALVALYGRIYDEQSLGAVSMLKMTGFGAVLVAIFSVLLVIRHTRTDEEAGRLELLGAAVLGRHAALAAALVLAIGTNLATGALCTVGLIGTGLPAAGSLAFGIGWTATASVFAAIAAVAAQLAESGRTVTGVSMATLGASYLLRAAGDAATADGPRWLSWLSPVGWGQQVRPYAGERWWVFALPMLAILVLVSCAFALQARRDLGAGLIRPRLGPASAAPSLRSPLALAWRLQRTGLLAWAAGFAILGSVLGSIAGNVGSLVDSPGSQELITKLGGAKNFTDAFLATEFGIAGIIASAYAVQATMRLRNEESAQRVEPLLATSVSRLHLLASHTLIAVAGAAGLLCIAGIAAGVVHGQPGRLLGAAVAQLPAALVLTGLTILVYGLYPRAAVASWASLVGFMLIGQFGPLLGLDQWVMDLSPYGQLPRLPGADWHPLALACLTATAVLLAAVGAIGFRRRDIG